MGGWTAPWTQPSALLWRGGTSWPWHWPTAALSTRSPLPLVETIISVRLCSEWLVSWLASPPWRVVGRVTWCGTEGRRGRTLGDGAERTGEEEGGEERLGRDWARGGHGDGSWGESGLGMEWMEGAWSRTAGDRREDHCDGGGVLERMDRAHAGMTWALGWGLGRGKGRGGRTGPGPGWRPGLGGGWEADWTRASREGRLAWPGLDWTRRMAGAGGWGWGWGRVNGGAVLGCQAWHRDGQEGTGRRGAGGRHGRWDGGTAGPLQCWQGTLGGAGVSWQGRAGMGAVGPSAVPCPWQWQGRGRGRGWCA